MTDVAVLGTGRMGAAMAARVAGAGHRVVVWNRTRATAQAVVDRLPGGRASVAESAAEAVDGCDVVLSMLADGAATRSVLLDSVTLDRLSSATVVCDLATSGADTARALDEALAARGVWFVDAPVSGSVPSVEAGTLLVMAGGTDDAVAAAAPVLAAFARRVVHLGSAGAGQAMKLAVNLVVHDLNAALSEALVLAEKSGVTRDMAYDVLQDSVVGAPFVHYKRGAFLDPDTPVAMSLDLVRKDLELISALASQVDAPHTVTSAALQVVAAACSDGAGALDMAHLSHLGRRSRSGVGRP